MYSTLSLSFAPSPTPDVADAAGLSSAAKAVQSDKTTDVNTVAATFMANPRFRLDDGCVRTERILFPHSRRPRSSSRRDKSWIGGRSASPPFGGQSMQIVLQPSKSPQSHLPNIARNL